MGSGSSGGCTGKNSDNLEPEYWYYSTHAPMDLWDFVNIWGIVEGVTYPYLRWTCVPKLTSFAPPSPVNDTVCNWRRFNVTVNQTVNVSWYLNNSLLHTNESVREASSCRLHAGVAGVHNVYAIASNANGSDMQTWIWNVTKAVELVITGKWLCVPDNCTICYNVTNVGNGTAHALTNIWSCGDVNCD